MIKAIEIAVLKYRLLFLFLLVTTAAWSQKQYSPLFLNALFDQSGYLEDYKILTGRLDDFIPVTISLGRKGDEICGMISYLGDDDEYILRGKKSKTGSFVLNEYFENEMFTATLELTLGTDEWTGTWSGRDNNVLVSLEGYYLGRPHDIENFPGDIVFYRSPDADLIGYESQGNPMPYTLAVRDDLFELYQTGGRSVASDIKNGLKHPVNLIFEDDGIRFRFDDREGEFRGNARFLETKSYYYYDFYQSVVAFYPYTSDEIFNSYISKIVDDWLEEIKKYSLINIDKEPSTRWLHSQQIWFEAHYFDKNMLSGVLHLKSSIPNVSKDRAILYNFKSAEPIPLDYYLKDTKSLEEEIRFDSNSDEIDLNRVSLSSAGLIYNVPFVALSGYKKFLINFDLIGDDLLSRRLPKPIQTRMNRK